MNHSSVKPVNSTTIISAYEALRDSVLTSPFSPVRLRSMKRLIAEGLHAWIMTLNGTPSNEPVRMAVDDSSAFTAQFNESDTIVQLIASMTLQSLTEEIDEYT